MVGGSFRRSIVTIDVGHGTSWYPVFTLLPPSFLHPVIPHDRSCSMYNTFILLHIFYHRSFPLPHPPPLRQSWFFFGRWLFLTLT